jgi:hypothetical protein
MEKNKKNERKECLKKKINRMKKIKIGGRWRCRMKITNYWGVCPTVRGVCEQIPIMMIYNRNNAKNKYKKMAKIKKRKTGKKSLSSQPQNVSLNPSQPSIKVCKNNISS